MKVTIELSQEEVRQAIAQKIANEASKHGHPDMTNRKISFTSQGTGPFSLEDLNIEVLAEIVTK